MNILDIQDKLKGLSQDQLAQEMQSPSGQVPQFLVLGEMSRRQAMRQSMQQQNAGSQTVAQELLSGAGVPSEGMSDMAQSMAPQSSIAQNTGIGSLPQEAPPPETGGIAALAPQAEQPVGMFAGGRVRKMAGGQAVDSGYTDPMGGTAYTGIEGIDTSDPNSTGNFYTDFIMSDEQQRRIRETQAAVAAANAAANAAPVAPGTPVDLGKLTALNTKPVVDDTTSGGGYGGGSGGGGKMSTYEQMLQDAMTNADKTAKQDKWLALAQAGAALYSGDSVGDALKTGISALQSARDTGEQNKLKLAQEMYGIQERQAALARASAASAASKDKPMTEAGAISGITSINDILKNMGGTDESGMPIQLSDAELAAKDELTQKRDRLIRYLTSIGSVDIDASDAPQ
jgi:hypothetical protein